MNATHGLSDRTVSEMQRVLSSFPQVEKAVLYGSRANGNFKTGSDIDLTLFGDELNFHLLARIDSELDDLLLPYQIDLSLFANLHHPELIDHIRGMGLPIYERATAATR